MENLDAWLVYAGIPAAWILYLFFSQFETPRSRRRIVEWGTENHKRLRQRYDQHELLPGQFMEAWRAESLRHFGGPCPHPTELIDGSGKCHGCLTYNHQTGFSRQVERFAILPLLFLILFLAFIWAILWGPWAEEFKNPPSRYDGCDVGDMCDENYPSM